MTSQQQGTDPSAVPGTPDYDALTDELRAQGEIEHADTRDRAAAAAADAPVEWSTIVVAYHPNWGANPPPPLRSLALRYDRQRAIVTEGGVHLMMRASVKAAERPDQVTGIMLGVNWFVSAPDEGLLQFTADAPMISVIEAQAAAPDMGAYRVIRRIDHGPERPQWYVE
jgi:hypothetical protein